MRVLVQHRKTLEYWRGLQQWAKEDSDALDFQRTTAAIEFCVREALTDAQVVLRFGDDRTLDIALPIRKPDASVAWPKRRTAA